MKPSSSTALALILSAALFAASALAQDAATGATPAPTAEAVPAAAPASSTPKKARHHKKNGHKASYESCLKEKLAAVEYFCNAHADACQAEKDGAAKQCRSEARGERQKG